MRPIGDNVAGFEWEQVADGTTEVVDLYGGSLLESERTLYPASPVEAMTSACGLLDDLARAKLEGRHIAIVDGAYDVPHDNHTWYLREARLRAAKRHFGECFDEADDDTKRAMVASDEVVLIVTLDADAKIAALKGFKPEKGGAERPVYTWSSRANRIGGFMVPAGNRLFRPVIDLVTVEGDPRHDGTMFESHLCFGKTLLDYGLLDTWVMFDEHQATIEKAAQIEAEHEANVLSIVRETDSRFVIDPRSGDYWSSSSIIKRIKGAV